MAANKIHIIGMGDDGLQGLTSPARKLVDEADLLVGPDGALAAIPPSKAERIVVSANLDETIERIARAGSRRVVVLASGDPLFYGVARYLVRQARQGPLRGRAARQQHAVGFCPREGKLGRGVSHQPGQSPAGAGGRKDSRGRQGRACSPARPCPPKAVARALLDRRIDYFSAYVCENLGSPDERVTQGELAEIAAQDFSPLNVMILVRKPQRARPAQRGHRPAAVRQSATKPFCNRSPSKGCSPRPKSGRSPWPRWTWARRAPCGTSAPAAARWPSKRRRSPRGGTTYAIEMDAEDHAPDHGQRRAVRRREPGGRAGPGPRGLA